MMQLLLIYIENSIVVEEFVMFGSRGNLQVSFFRTLTPLLSPIGFAFVEFEDKRDAEYAVKDMDGRQIMGKRVRCELSRRGGARGEEVAKSARGPPQRTPYRIKISGLPENASWKELKDIFRKDTEPVYVDLRGRGTAVAEFAAEADVGRAIELFNDTKVMGSRIRIEKDLTDGNERSDSWQKVDRPSRREGGRDRDRDRDRGGGRDRSRSRERYSGRDRSRSRDRYRGSGRDRDRDRDRRGDRDRKRSPSADRRRDRARDDGDDGRKSTTRESREDVAPKKSSDVGRPTPPDDTENVRARSQSGSPSRQEE